MTPAELIAAMDLVLAGAAAAWLAATSPADKAKWRNQLNDNLDARIKLMALRDPPSVP